MITFLRSLVAALIAALLWSLPQTAAASHFRFANLSWKRAPGTNSLAVEVTVTEAWRSGSFGQGEIYYDFGDGSSGFTTATATRIATLTDTAGEEYEVWRYTSTHTYPSNGLFQVSGSSCCRISTLVNAADASESFQMGVDLRSNTNTGSPVTTAPVILQMQAGANNSIPLPIVDPDGDAFTVRLATSAESSISSLPTVGANTISVTAGGVLNWNTVGGTSGQKFALQVIIEENRASNTSGTNGTIPLDFIIELAGSLTNLPPTVTGPSGSLTIGPNQTFTATFVGTDPEGGPLRVNHQGLPPGATITPADGTTNGSPTSVTFSWRPAPSDVGSSYAVLIFFTDQGGLQRAASFALTVSAAAGLRDFELVSINSTDTASGGAASLNPVVSSNGQYVAFASDAANLVANDNNGLRDVFWRDRLSGTTRLVSRTPAGASGNGDSDAPVISPDGRFVAFHSRASNLTANDGNTNYDVFLWDAHDSTVTLVSRTPAGASGTGDSYSPQISASGRIVSFASMAVDLVGNDTNGTSDAFARDLDLSVTYLVSINTNGASGNGSCGVPVLSANGRYVAFLSRANDLVTNDFNTLNDVFVHDLQTRVTTLVSVNVAGTGAGNRLSFDPVISADGRYVAFASQATNLVIIPDNNNFPDVFVRDMQMGVTKLVSVNRFGTAAGGNGGVPAVLPASFTPFVSADGTKVLFVSIAQDLVANDANGKQDVFLRDHINNTTTLISVNRFGTASGNAASGIGASSMSADLRYVAFFSEASNVGAADTNNKTDVFLRDLATNSTKIISRVNLGGFAASGHSFQPVISADGSTILFTSEADNLDNRDGNGASDVFAAATSLGTPNFGIVDVAVSITSVGPRTVGAPFTLTITVTNHSAAPATGLVVGNSGPELLQFVSASVSQGAVDATVLTWQVGDLAANGSATATVTLVATNLGAGNVVSSIIQRDQLDANLNNNAALSSITADQTAAGALFYLPGNTPYLSRTNSPFFAQILAGTVTVEDFESGAFNFLGVTASVGTVIAPSASTDSVDADDGAVDGNGNGGHSFFVTGTNSVTFSFNPVVLGRLPTKVGVVLTDGDNDGAGIEAFDTNGVSLGVIGPFEIGDNSFFGETGEDRFLGVEFAGGISALRVYYASPGFELDHLQFDIPTTDLRLTGTAPSGAVASQSFNVTLAVTNLGPSAVTAAVVTNANPTPVALNNVVATAGAFDSQTGQWNIGPLAVGAGATLTFTFTATNSGQLQLQSRVSGNVPDRNSANDTVTHTVLLTNLAPTLTFASAVVGALEDAGAQTVPAFALMSAVEPAQSITNVMVRNNNPGLFLILPAIALNGTLTFTPAANVSGSAVVEVFTQDNGGTANGGVDGVTNTFTITVTNVNDAPVISFASANVGVLEDAGPQTLAGFVTASVGPVDEAGQSITNYAVTSSAPGLFLVAPAIALNGTLTFTTAANSNGSATITVVAQDDGGTANGGVNQTTNTFTITVTNVNDAPIISFASANVGVLEDAGAQTVPGFVTANVGPADEVGKSITNYAVTTSAPGLFLVAPAIALNGTLTFTPAANSNGLATITVVAQDDGGTANGGVDRTTNTFTITVTNVNDAPSFALGMASQPLVTTLAHWGWNNAGQQDVPADFTNAVQVAPGGYHVIGLRSDGTVVGWSGAASGLRAPPAGLSGVTAIAAGNDFNFALKQDGTVVSWGEVRSTAINVPPGLTNVMAVEAGDSHGLALLSNRTVVAWGDNSSGQTSIPAGLTNVVAISAQGFHSLALLADGTVVAWGDNGGGQVTVPSGLTNVVAVSAGYFHSLALRADGTVVAWGYNVFGQGAVPAGVTNVAAIAAGVYHNVALLQDGTVRAWGYNDVGQASVPEGLAGVTRISAANATSFAIGTNLNFGVSLTVLEDSGPFTLPLAVTNISAGPSDEAGQAVSFVLSSDNPGLFSVAPAIAANGTLTFTPATNAYGVARVTVVAQDNGGVANGGVSAATNIFTLIVTPVNDAPSVTLASPGVTVAFNAGAQTVPAYALFGSGASNESGQTVLGYSLSSDNPGLFAAGPAISLAGDLTFTSTTGVAGVANVTATVYDSGGTANGGVDSFTTNFSVMVTAYAPVGYTWLGGTGDWNDPAQWTPNGVPGAFDSAAISSGTAQLTNNVSVGIAALSGGSITGVGNLTVVTNLTWSAGTFDGTGTLIVPAGGAATLSGGSTKTLRRQFDNAGTVTWTGGSVQGNNNPSFNNLAGGLFDVQSAGVTFFATSDSSVRTFNNAGTLRKTAGAGTTTWEGVLNNTGTLEVQTGTMQFSSGSGLWTGTASSALGATLRWSGGAYQFGNGVTLTGDGSWEQVGGTLDALAGVTVTMPGAFALNSGVLGGAGNYTVPSGAGFVWISGTLGTGGVFTVAAGGTALLSGGSTKSLLRQFNNAGTVTWTGGSVQGNNNPTFNNLAGGIFDAQVAGVTFFTTTDSSVRTFNNAGTVRKTVATGSMTWQGVMNNAGTLEVQTGTLDLSGSGLSSGTFTNATAGLLTWSSGTHELTNGAAFTGTGTIRIIGGTVNVGAGAAVSHTGTFELTSGTLGGAGSFTVSVGSQFNWAGGTMQTGGVFTVSTGASATLSSGSTKVLRRQFDNAGTVTWTAGAVQGNDSPTFNNQSGAVFDVQVDNSFYTTSDSSVRTFNNAGTLRKTTGTGTTSWLGVMNNTGTLEVRTGTLDLSGGGLSSGAFTNMTAGTLTWSSGTHQLTNGAAFTGTGTNRISGGTVNVGTGAAVSHTGMFEMTSGTLGGAGSFTVSSSGLFNWTGGTMATGGVFTVSAGSSATLGSGATKVLRRQFDNFGTVTWIGGAVQGNDTPTFNNQAGALFEVQTDSSFFTTSDNSVRVFNNVGTVRKTAGTGTTSWDGTFNNAGALQVQAGTLNLTGDGLSSGTFNNAAGTVLSWTTSFTHELTNGVTFTGPGTARVVAGTVAVSAGVTVSHEGTFELTGGTLGGAGNFTVPAASQFNWTGGTLGTGGVFNVAAGGNVTLSGGATKVLRRLFDNAGTVTWTGGTVQGNSNPTFNNQPGGLLDMQVDGTWFSSSDSSTRTFLNLGTVRKSAGTGTTVWQDVVNNSGTIDVQTGTLQLTGSGLSSGAFTGSSGSLLEWSSGTHQLANGVNFGLTGTRRVSGGTVSIVAGASLSATGVMELTGGTLGGVGGIIVPAAAQFNWTGGTLGTGGVFTVASGATLTASSGSTKSLRRQFDNFGTFTWTAGQVAAGDGPTFNNQTGALFDVQADTSFFNNLGGATPVFNNSGTLRKSAGTGTTTWFGALSQSGLLELRTGKLTLGTPPNIGGGSSLTVFLGGTTAGTQFGQLIAGDVPFAGTLNVVLTNGFVPAISNSFLIVDGGTGSGTFTSTTGRVLGNGLVLETNYSGGDLTLLALAVNTAPSFTFTNFPATEGVQDWIRDAVSDPGAGRKVAVDGAGSIIVAGDYSAPGGEGSQRDLMVVKYDAAGSLIWSNAVDTVSLMNDQLVGLALDPGGNVLLLGAVTVSTTNFATVKLTGSNGAVAWTRFFDGGGEDVPAAIATDVAGNVFVTGTMHDPLSQSHADYVTIKYAANGDTNWVQTNSYASIGVDTARALAVDGNGDVVVTGTGSDTDFYFAFTVKLAGADGTTLWTTNFPNSTSDNSDGKAIAVDAAGNVLVAADLLEVVYKLAVVKYDAAGALQWTNTFTRSGVDASVRGLAVDGSGNPIITGTSYNGTDTDFTTIKFDATTGDFVWINYYDLGGQGSGDQPNAIAVNAAGEVFVTGHSFGSNGKDYLTVKYSAAGAGVWTNRYDSAGSSNVDDAHALAVDTNGNVYVTGESDTLFRTIKYAVIPSTGANQTVASTNAPVSLTGFITSISPGTTNEAAQTVSFSVNNDNNSLFTVQPAISAAGTLTYTVNASESGSATVTVTAQDSGGTANGGSDTSAPQIFLITVTNAASAPNNYVWGSAGGVWHDASNWTPRGVPGALDSATISSGFATLTNGVAVRSLTLSGGGLIGTGSLTVRSNMVWSGGQLGGAGTTTITSNAVLTVSSAADKDLRRRLDNFGTVTWTAGRILGHDSAILNNYPGALLDAQSDTTLFESGDGTTKTLNNSGTLRKSAGTGTTSLFATFNQNGIANVQTGTINAVGTVTLGNSSYSGAGEFLLGNCTLAGTITIASGANVEFGSGTMSGTGTIVGTLNWTAGTMGMGGTTTIATSGVLVVSTGADKDLRRTLDNYGTLTWTGGRILGHDTPVLHNRAGAVFDAQVDTTLYESGDGTTKTFNNLGTVRRSAGVGTTTWNGQFNNDSVLRVETGTVSLNGGGTSAGTFTNLAGAVLQFTGGTHTLNSGATFTGAGQGLVNGGNVNLAAGTTATASGTFGVASGILGGTGTLLVTSGGQFTWTGGQMAGTTGRTVITNGATMTVSSGADKDLRRILDNYGTVIWTAGRITGHDTPTLNNYAGALFDAQQDNTVFESGDGTTKTFNNAGTLRKSAGTGTTTFNGTFNQSGTADVQTGTVNPAGTLTLNTSTNTGAGRFLITGGTMAGTVTIGSGANVELASGVLGGTGIIIGTLNWTSGTMGSGGTTIIATNGAVVASSGADKDLRRTLDNFGTITWTGGRIVGHTSPTLHNRAGAVFEARTDLTLFESGDGTVKTFANDGTVRRTTGTGTTTWNGLFNNFGTLVGETGTVALNGGGTSAGVFTNLAGATIEFTGGTQTLNTGAIFGGAGTNLVNGGTVNVSATATVTASGKFGVANGTLGGIGTLQMPSGSQFLWTGGTMSGTTGRTVINSGATMTVSTGADKDLQRILDNNGTITWTAGRILGHATPILNNYASALLDVQVDTTLFDSGDGSVKTFNNAGTLRKSAGTGTTTFHGTFNHSGTANIQTGTLHPDGVVTATAASYSGAGRFLFASGTLTGTQTVAGGANVELASGSLLGTWSLVGVINWTGGTLDAGGTTTITAGSTLLVSGGADKDLRRTLNNSGTVLWTVGRILGHNTAIINNLAGATFETQTAASLYESGDGTVKTFNNNGTVRKSIATGTSIWNGTFNNNGALEIQIGILSLANSYTPSAGSSLKVFLGGLTAGTQHGQLQVTGSTAFSGTLDIVLTNGFTPVVPNSFLIVDSSVSGSGLFSSLQGAALDGGLSLVPNYLLGDLTLVTTQSAPLSPQAVGSERLIRWPGAAGDFILESSTSITGPWSPVLVPVAQEDGTSVVRLPAEGTRFYRLVRPPAPRPGDNPTQ